MIKITIEGPPGSGKTLLAYAIKDMINVSASLDSGGLPGWKPLAVVYDSERIYKKKLHNNQTDIDIITKQKN